jgi:hypothetical protein
VFNNLKKMDCMESNDYSCRKRVLEIIAMRRTLTQGIASDEMRNLHNQKLYNLYSSPNIIKKNSHSGQNVRDAPHIVI